MSKKTFLVSDLSGQQIDGRAATATIAIDGEDKVYKLDLTVEEARELGSKGEKVPKRGRPSKKQQEAGVGA